MKKILFLVFALVLMSWSQAFASYSYTFSYVDSTHSFDISGTLVTATNTPEPLQVIDGSFVTGGDTYTICHNSILPPSNLTSPSGYFLYDNYINPSSTPMLTPNGLLFTSSTGNEINIWGNSGAYDYTYYVYTPGVGYTIEYAGTGTFTASAVPIPAAVWLLGTGLVGLVGIRRRIRS